MVPSLPSQVRLLEAREATAKAGHFGEATSVGSDGVEVACVFSLQFVDGVRT